MRHLLLHRLLRTGTTLTDEMLKVGGPRRFPSTSNLLRHETRYARSANRALHAPRIDSSNSRGPRLHYPTDPSISSAIRRLSSTAYSSGSSLTIGSTKPRAIMFIASSALTPRLIR